MTHGVHIAADLGFIPGNRLDYGLTLIERAAAAGADSVVIGYAPPYMVMLPYTEKGDVNPDFERLAATMLSRKSLLALRDRADQLGLQMGLRVYDGESGWLAVEFGMAYLRIASGDLVNDRLLRSLAETGVSSRIGHGDGQPGRDRTCFVCVVAGGRRRSDCAARCLGGGGTVGAFESGHLAGIATDGWLAGGIDRSF